MRIESLISQLESVFKGQAVKPTQCITFEKSQLFYIADDKISGKCVILKQLNLEQEDEKGCFKITNDNETQIALWAIDGCFFSSGQKERCDCAFFNENDFCFAEFKLNATSLQSKLVNKHREKAISQLKSTIITVGNSFTKNGFTFLEYNLEAYLCTPSVYPNKNSSISSYAVEFLEDYGVKLYEQNYKVFK